MIKKITMEIEKQVCDLQQAKRLKELGVRQKSSCRYCFYPDGSYCFEICVAGVWLQIQARDFIKHDWSNARESFASAYTVAELGVMLPNYHESHRGAEGSWYCCELEKDEKWFAIEENEAKARAAMLIYLLENKIITAEEVNKNL